MPLSLSAFFSPFVCMYVCLLASVYICLLLHHCLTIYLFASVFSVLYFLLSVCLSICFYFSPHSSSSSFICLSMCICLFPSYSLSLPVCRSICTCLYPSSSPLCLSVYLLLSVSVLFFVFLLLACLFATVCLSLRHPVCLCLPSSYAVAIETFVALVGNSGLESQSASNLTGVIMCVVMDSPSYWQSSVERRCTECSSLKGSIHWVWFIRSHCSRNHGLCTLACP